MASQIDPVEQRVKEVLHDISYFEQYDLPQSPPDTPPINSDGFIPVKARTPMHSTLEQVFPRTPPQSPRFGLKRKFSSNFKSTFGLATPPATPPTKMNATLAKNVSEDVNSGHKISVFPIKNRPTIITIDVTGPSDECEGTPSRRMSLRRSSSYSSDSSISSGKDPIDRIKDYSARSIEGRYPSPGSAAPPAYSPPPNTPANMVITPGNMVMTPAHYTTSSQIRGMMQAGGPAPVDNDPFNPFSYTGPTQYPAHSQNPAPVQQSNGLWQQSYPTQFPNLPSPTTFQQQQTGSITDLEKARQPSNEPDHSETQRHGKRKALICIIILLVMLMLVAAVVVVVFWARHRHQQHEQQKNSTSAQIHQTPYVHNKRFESVSGPGMYIKGVWRRAYIKRM